MQSRRYVKRIWRVPQHRGPVEYFGTALTKALVKHGWPCRLVLHDPENPWYDEWSFQIQHHETGRDAAPDFWAAIDVACRVVARSYRVDVSCVSGFVTFNRPYVLVTGGHFKEAKP